MRKYKHPTTEQDYNRARALRNNATPFEKKLWLALRKRTITCGLKFRRQVVIHPFIADFACMQAKLLIELDGYSHDVRVDYDLMRERKLTEAGYTFLRFSNEDVDKNLEGVVTMILDQANKLIHSGSLLPPPPTPSLEGRGSLHTDRPL